jgi:AraC-like DNA-binding protein
MFSKEKSVDPKSDYYIYTPGALARDLFLYPTIVGDFKYEPGYNLYRESFDSFLCFIVKDGSCTVTVQGKNYVAFKNQIVFLNCYEPHSYGSSTSFETKWMHFDGHQAKGFFEAITGSDGPILTLSSTYRFEKYLDRIYSSFKSSQPLNDAVLNNWIINMMTELLVSKEHGDKVSGQSDIIEDVVSYIMENLSEDIPLEGLAKKANLSPFYFSRLFKKETGFTPHDYIITTRVNHARYLLLTTDLSIKDICFQLGFSSESAFCTTFRKKTGQTPGDFRGGRSKDV